MSDVDSLLNKIAEALKPDFLVAEISVAGLATGPVLEVSGEESISKQFQYTVAVELDGPPPDLSPIIGAQAKLTVRDATGNDRIVTGIVADILAESFDADTHRAQIVIKPKIYRQNLGRDCYAMQDVDSVDVIKDVLADYTGKVRYELARDYPRYPYRVQYREDDWTYISRLAEEEGIYYWFDHEGDDSTVVFADTSANAPPIEGVPVLAFADPSSMRPDQEAIVEVSFEAKMVATKFSGRSFDPDRPLLKIEATDGEGKREEYDAPGAGPVEPAVLKFRIKNANEAAKAAKAGISGLATSARLTPGRTFTLTGHPSTRFMGEFLVTGMTLTATMKRPAVVRFTAIPKDVPFRPLRVTPVAKQAGLQMGQVVGPDGQEVFPDKRGRVRTQLHWDRLGAKNESSGTWMRIDQRGAPGSQLLPRMGWNVATFNDEGGVDAPAILCRIHDGDHPPEYELPKNMTQVVWKTLTTPYDGTANEVRFEDAAGRQEMFINASKDMNVRTRNKKREAVCNNHTLKVGNDYEKHVYTDAGYKVAQDQTVKIDGDEEMEIVKSYAMGVGDNQTREIEGDEDITAGGSISLSVDEDRELTVEGSMTETSLGDIQLHVTENCEIKVEGSLERVAGQTITDASDKKYVQKIGEDKVEVAEGERTSNVTKTLKETVDGSIEIETNDEFADNAEELQKIVVTKKMSGEAPEVWIEAVDQIRVKCGSSVITLTKTAITFEGTNLKMTGKSVDADSAAITNN